MAVTINTTIHPQWNLNLGPLVPLSGGHAATKLLARHLDTFDTEFPGLHIPDMLPLLLLVRLLAVLVSHLIQDRLLCFRGHVARVDLKHSHQVIRA